MHQNAAEDMVNPGSIEWIRQPTSFKHCQFCLFDFDGTLSLIRAGWQEVMITYLVEVLQETGTDESESALTALVTDFVTELTGKQTIYQMIRLAEEVSRRGGTPLDPVAYKHEYLRRLWLRIRHRVDGLEQGTISPDELLVPGSIDLLNTLKDAGMTLYLASGTDEPYVIKEAKALGIDHYFAGIFGAIDDYKSYSKALVIQRILSEHQIRGEKLLGFGDGYVEIENIKAVGGIAIGVASDELGQKGLAEWKRQRLIKAGADVIIPDYRELGWLRERLV